MANVSRGLIEFFDDLHNYAFASNQVVHNAATGSASVSVADVHNGVLTLRLTNAETDAVELYIPNIFKPTVGTPLIGELNVAIRNTGKTAAFVGFTSDTSDVVPIENEDGTLNSISSDAFGFMYEGEQSTRWSTVAVNNDVDADVEVVDTYDVVQDKFTTLRVEMNEDGDVWFYVDNNLVRFEENLVRPSQGYYLVASADGRGTSGSMLSVDYFYLCAPRSKTFNGL